MKTVLYIILFLTSAASAQERIGSKDGVELTGLRVNTHTGSGDQLCYIDALGNHHRSSINLASVGGGSSGVTFFNGRTGAVAPVVDDYSSFYSLLNHTHSYTTLTDKPTIPTNNNQLTNGALYITNVTGFVTNGSGITRSGSGTLASPYVFSSSQGAYAESFTLTSSLNYTISGDDNAFNLVYTNAQDGIAGLLTLPTTTWNNRVLYITNRSPVALATNVSIATTEGGTVNSIGSMKTVKLVITGTTWNRVYSTTTD